MFRLNQKHSNKLYYDNRLAPPDGRLILSMQSPGAAIVSAITAMVLFNSCWMLFTSALNRVFPWLVIVQGALIGLAVRRYGQGLDWRFPVIAVTVAGLGAYAGNLLLAADTAADEFGIGPMQVLLNMSDRTLGLYWDEVVTPVDHLYAFCAAAVAAFLAKRRLTRAEEFAFRTRSEDPGNHEKND